MKKFVSNNRQLRFKIKFKIYSNRKKNYCLKLLIMKKYNNQKLKSKS